MYRAEVESHRPATRTSWPWVWLPVAAMLVAVYLTAQVSLSDLIPGQLNVLFLQPVLWTYVALFSLVLWRYGLRSRPRAQLGILTRALIIAVFQVGAWLLAGLVFGFGLSPYGQGASILLGNALYAVTALLGMELARACIVVSLGERNPSLALAVGAGLLTLLSIPVGQYGTLVDVPNILRFAGEIFLPTLATNLLASILVLGAGPTAALLYRGVLVSFEWLFPILPDLEWIVSAFIGTMPAALGMLSVEEYFRRGASDEAQGEDERGRVPGVWLFAAAALVTLLFFNAGSFGYRPTLVSGPSMKPSFATGDVVITAPVSPEAVRVGDVIRFRTEEGHILHRVKAIEVDEAGPQFITRGDGNNVDDEPIVGEQIEGRMILLVPKVGWPVILIRSLIQSLL